MIVISILAFIISLFVFAGCFLIIYNNYFMLELMYSKQFALEKIFPYMMGWLISLVSIIGIIVYWVM